MTELPQAWREKIADRQWYPSGIPYQVQEDGFIYGEFHREEYAILFAKALTKAKISPPPEAQTGRPTGVSIWGPDGWVEYEDE